MNSLELHIIDDAGGPGWDDLLAGRFCAFSEDHPGGSAPIEDMFALPGADGARAIELLRRAKDEGEAELLAVANQAIRRLASDPDWITTTTLFSDEELERLQNAFSATVAAADLLGRSRIIAIANREREGVQTFSDGEYNGFEVFADPIPPQPPRSAVEYFRSLIPSLNIDPSRYGPGLMRQAFTLAYATDQTLLQRVKGVILNYLRGRRDRIAPIAGMRANDVVPTGTEAIQKLLDDAGVSPRSPQYCFLPGTRVEGMALAASKAWYEGPAVQIKTDDGRTLSVTVNHPILTPHGWKRAGDIRQGDDLLCYGNPIESFLTPGSILNGRENPRLTISNSRSSVGAATLVRAPYKRRAIHDQQAPPCIEDVFESIRSQSSSVSSVQLPVSSLDFYGDAAFFPRGVHRVWAYRELVGERHAHRSQIDNKRIFVQGDISPPNPPRMGRGLLNFALDRSFHTKLATREFAKNLGLSFGCDIVPESLHAFTPASQIDPLIFKASSKSLGGDVQLARKLIEGLPGSVSSHRVVNIKRISWSGHVYDLQTTTGFIISEGIVTSNCEMVFRTNTLDAYNAGSWAEISHPDNGDVFPVWQYLGIRDGRQGEDHEPQFDRYYEVRFPFAKVRGPRVWNCRCAPRALTRRQWERAQANGAVLSQPPQW